MPVSVRTGLPCGRQVMFTAAVQAEQRERQRYDDFLEMTRRYERAFDDSAPVSAPRRGESTASNGLSLIRADIVLVILHLFIFFSLLRVEESCHRWPMEFKDKIKVGNSKILHL